VRKEREGEGVDEGDRECGQEKLVRYESAGEEKRGVRKGEGEGESGRE